VPTPSPPCVTTPAPISPPAAPSPTPQLAKACGLTAPGAPSYLYKVLRVLAQHSLLDELPGKVFAPNTATRELVQGEDPSLGHMVHHLVNGPKWDAWKMLPEVGGEVEC
jgi:hypothetical protein